VGGSNIVGAPNGAVTEGSGFLAGAWVFALLVICPLAADTDPSVMDFGARCDVAVVADGAMRAGSVTLASAAASFQASDVGKTVFVSGAGTGVGKRLRSAIAAFTDAHRVDLRDAAAATVAGAKVLYGSNDTAAFGNADAQMGGLKTLRIPAAGCLIDSFRMTQSYALEGASSKASTLFTTADPYADDGVAHAPIVWVLASGAAIRNLTLSHTEMPRYQVSVRRWANGLEQDSGISIGRSEAPPGAPYPQGVLIDRVHVASALSHGISIGRSAFTTVTNSEIGSASTAVLGTGIYGHFAHMANVATNYIHDTGDDGSYWEADGDTPRQPVLAASNNTQATLTVAQHRCLVNQYAVVYGASGEWDVLNGAWPIMAVTPGSITIDMDGISLGALTGAAVVTCTYGPVAFANVSFTNNRIRNTGAKGIGWGAGMGGPPDSQASKMPGLLVANNTIDNTWTAPIKEDPGAFNPLVVNNTITNAFGNFGAAPLNRECAPTTQPGAIGLINVWHQDAAGESHAVVAGNTAEVSARVGECASWNRVIGLYAYGSTLSVSKNRFTGNGMTVAGVLVAGASTKSASIRENVFAGFSYGVNLSSAAQIHIVRNTFQGLGAVPKYAIYLSGTDGVTVVGNTLNQLGVSFFLGTGANVSNLVVRDNHSQ
jgi:hypothetical protein